MRNNLVVKLTILFTFLFLSPDVFAWDYEVASKTQVHSVIADDSGQNITVACSNGGLWQTENGGLSWEPVNSRFDTAEKLNVIWQRQSAINSSRHIAFAEACNEQNLYSTENGGETWDYITIPHSVGYTFNAKDKAVISQYFPDRIYLLNSSMYGRSLDYGENWDVWSFYNHPSEFYDLKEDISNEAVLYATSSYKKRDEISYYGFIKSTDYGRHWNCNQPIIDFYEEFGISDCNVYSFCQMSNGEFILSIECEQDGWTNNNFILLDSDESLISRSGSDLVHGFVAKTIVEDIEIPGKLYALDDKPSYLYISNDYGRTWSPCTGEGLPQSWQCFNAWYQNDRSGDIYIASESFGLYKSCDNASTWEKIPDPPIGSSGIIRPFEVGVYVSDNDKINLWKLDEEGNEYEPISFLESDEIQYIPRSILYANDDTLVVFTEYYNRDEDNIPRFEITHSYDQGLSWVTVYDSPPILGLTYEPVVYSDDDYTLIGSFSLSGDSISYSEDLGITWSTFEVASEDYIYLTYYLFIHNDKIYIPAWNSLGTDKIYRYNVTTNQLEDLNYPFANINIDHPSMQVYGELLFIALQDGSFCMFDGQDWYEKTTLPGGRSNGLALIPNDDNPILATSVVNHYALYVSTDLGETWIYSPIDHEYSVQNTKVLNPQYDPFRERVWVDTGIGPMWIDADDLVNPMGVDPVEVHPVEMDVISCYPNPFNSSARIKYKVQHPGIVTLRMYDITGRLVKECLHNYKVAGAHEYFINATRLASGTYFVRLDMNHQAYVEKITLIK